MANKLIYEVEEIEKVVNFMKTEKTITDIVENSGIYTITSNTLVLLRETEIIYLQVGQIVTIDNINYKVLTVNLTLKTFTITKGVTLYHMSTDLIPVKVLDVTKWNLSVNYMYGSRIEINQRLENAKDDPDQKLTRFPLIWHFINNKQDDNPSQGVDIKTTIEFAFVNLTEKTYTTIQRKNYNFKPIIDPLLILFKETLQSCYFNKVFYFEDRKTFEHGKWYRYFYGSSDKNVPVLDAATDAIEVSFDLQFLQQFS